MGAFGAHALRGKVEARKIAPRMLDIFLTGAQYQMYHALALVGVGLLAAYGRPSSALVLAGWAFLIGTLLFSGSLYTMALTGMTKLGAITPLGGLAFLLGWAALAWAALEPRAAG